MAGHVQDRWYRTETGSDGKTVKGKTDRYGNGLRYRARYIGPDGTEKSKSFPDRKKREAERWLANIEADMSRGQYIDPTAGKITFRKYAEDWLASQTTDPATRVAVESRLRLHAFPYLGTRPLASFQPSHIRYKLRDVPLPDSVAAVLATHMTAFPPVEVTLPWLRSDGPPVTKLLYFATLEGGALRRNDFNTHAWKPALVSAGIIPVPGVGERYKASREDGMHALRHFYASVLLDSGESVKAVSTYLGHSDAGFTLRTYTHLMPTSETRTRKAVDAVYRKARGGPRPGDGPLNTREPLPNGKPLVRGSFG